MLRTVTIDTAIKSAHAALHFACALSPDLMLREIHYFTPRRLPPVKEAAKDTKCAVFE